MTGRSAQLRIADPDDGAALVRLWALLFEDSPLGSDEAWKGRSHEWFVESVAGPSTARFPVVEVADEIVATAVGTLELGVPNPWCPHGRTVRLANVITAPAHRGRGFGTMLALDVVDWARTIGADRVDLSATPDGRRLYERIGFAPTSAPRMKLVL
jgi:GNAT superfamily N-acetyltransferase